MAQQQQPNLVLAGAYCQLADTDFKFYTAQCIALRLSLFNKVKYNVSSLCRIYFVVIGINKHFNKTSLSIVISQPNTDIQVVPDERSWKKQKKDGRILTNTRAYYLEIISQHSVTIMLVTYKVICPNQ